MDLYLYISLTTVTSKKLSNINVETTLDAEGTNREGNEKKKTIFTHSYSLCNFKRVASTICASYLFVQYWVNALIC